MHAEVVRDQVRKYGIKYGIERERPVFRDTFNERGLVTAKAQEMAYDIMNHGQPFAESVLAELMRRGANTPEQNGDWLRRGLLDEVVHNAMMGDEEIARTFHRYHIPRWRRVIYRAQRKINLWKRGIR